MATSREKPLWIGIVAYAFEEARLVWKLKIPVNGIGRDLPDRRCWENELLTDGSTWITSQYSIIRSSDQWKPLYVAVSKQSSESHNYNSRTMLPTRLRGIHLP